MYHPEFPVPGTAIDCPPFCLTGELHAYDPKKYQLACNPRLVDGEFLQDFYDRWSAWLAKAVANEIQTPKVLPEEAIEERFRGK